VGNIEDGELFGDSLSPVIMPLRSKSFSAAKRRTGLTFGDELLRFAIAEAAGVGKVSGDFLVAIEFREIGFVGNGCDEHLAAFLGRTDGRSDRG
jgi:hypothetical protein